MGAAVFQASVAGWAHQPLSALLMTLCNGHFPATQFALLSALSAGTEVMSAPWRVGLLKHTAGHSISFRRRCRTGAYFAAGLPPDA